MLFFVESAVVPEFVVVADFSVGSGLASVLDFAAVSGLATMSGFVAVLDLAAISGFAVVSGFIVVLDCSAVIGLVVVLGFIVDLVIGVAGLATAKNFFFRNLYKIFPRITAAPKIIANRIKIGVLDKKPTIKSTPKLKIPSKLRLKPF